MLEDFLPRYLDILIILDDEITYTRIYKSLPRCTDYITKGLRYLRDKGLITIKENPKNAKGLIITMTPKGRDTQRIVITLYNNLGIQMTRKK
jgi:DNA-binding MarR family transcriptional regulator